MSVVPISGQPGLFRDERRSLEFADYLDGNFAPAPVRWHALRDLGDARQDAIHAKLADVTAQYNTTHTNATKLLAAFGPLDETTLLNLGEAIKALKARDAGAIARLTGAQFAGIVRMGLAAAKGNIVRAEAITNGNLAGHEAIAEQLLVAAKNVIDAIGSVVNNATAAVGTATGYAQSVGLGRVQTQNVRPLYGTAVTPLFKGLRRVETRNVQLSDLGIVIADDVAIALIVAAGVLVGVALLLGVYVYIHQSQAASDAADAACARDTAAGRPCTGGQWIDYRMQAVQQQRDLSPIPDLDPLFSSASSLLFWGGLIAVVAGVAYVGWTAAPAAAITRERLRTSASRL